MDPPPAEGASTIPRRGSVGSSAYLLCLVSSFRWGAGATGGASGSVAASPRDMMVDFTEDRASLAWRAFIFTETGVFFSSLLKRTPLIMSCASSSEEVPVLSPGEPLTPYWKMSEADRESRKAYARMRYQDPVIKDRMKRNQYMKSLRAGLIQQPKPATLARNGIALGADGEYAFILET